MSAYCGFIFSPLLAQIHSSSFINLLQNPPLLVDFITSFTPFAPYPRLFLPPPLLMSNFCTASLFIPSSSAIR